MIHYLWISSGRRDIKLCIKLCKQLRIEGKGEDIIGQGEPYECLHVQPTEESKLEPRSLHTVKPEDRKTKLSLSNN